MDGNTLHHTGKFKMYVMYKTTMFVSILNPPDYVIDHIEIRYTDRSFLFAEKFG